MAPPLAWVVLLAGLLGSGCGILDVSPAPSDLGAPVSEFCAAIAEFGEGRPDSYVVRARLCERCRLPKSDGVRR